MKKKLPSRVLVISDTHIPWEHKDYLKHCKKVYKRFKCNKVVHIGDLVDAYGFSYFDKSADSISLTEEITKVEKHMKPWIKAFPNVTVTIGNHTIRAVRRLVGSGLPKRLWPSMNEVFNVHEGWQFVDHVYIDGTYFTHGEQGDARKLCLSNQANTVSGHAHTKMGIEYHTNRQGEVLWGMQIGTGIDHDAYVFDYAKNHKSPQLGCGVVIDGKEPFIVPFNPKDYE